MSIESYTWGYCKKCNKKIRRTDRTCYECGEENPTPEHTASEKAEFFIKGVSFLAAGMGTIIVCAILVIVFIIIMYAIIET